MIQSIFQPTLRTHTDILVKNSNRLSNICQRASGRGSIASATLFTSAASSFVANLHVISNILYVWRERESSMETIHDIDRNIVSCLYLCRVQCLNVLAWMYRVANAVSIGVLMSTCVLVCFGQSNGRFVTRELFRPLHENRPMKYKKFVNPS